MELWHVLTRAGARPESSSRGNAAGEPPCGDPPMNARHAGAGRRVVDIIHFHAEVLASRQQRCRAARCRAAEGIFCGVARYVASNAHRTSILGRTRFLRNII